MTLDRRFMKIKEDIRQLSIIFLFLLLSSSISVSAQRFTFVELNCENLFDYHHDEGKDDTEYLPEATRHWTKQRYWRKLNNIAQELSTLNDLTKRSLLRHAGYEYLMTNSPDVRGIDVALLYSPFTFAPIRSYSIRVTPVEHMRPTRDILYACGQTVSGDTLHVFVVHFPSRFGGEKYSQPFRQAAADRLCQSIDSIQTVTSEPKILIAGDFNDGDESLIIQQIERHDIHNLTKESSAPKDIQGTYRYKGQWESIDHILGSPYIFNKVCAASIHAPQFLLEDEKRYGGYRPRRTYNGPRYQPGYSDHLPLVVRFRW